MAFDMSALLTKKIFAQCKADNGDNFRAKQL